MSNGLSKCDVALATLSHPKTNASLVAKAILIVIIGFAILDRRGMNQLITATLEEMDLC
jgi:hypothetical protein